MKSNAKLKWNANFEAFWIPRISEVNLSLPKNAREISINLSSGPTEIYDYFPFLVNIYINDQIQAIIEFEKPWQKLSARLPIPHSSTDVRIGVSSELGCSPIKKSAGQDHRELALLFESVQVHHEALLPKVNPLTEYDPLMAGVPFLSEAHHPIFVIGCYRSGTSISTWAIGQAPNIYPMEETGWLSGLYFGARAAIEMTSSTTVETAIDVYDLGRHAFLQSQGCAISNLHWNLSRFRAEKTHLERHSGKGRFHPNFRVGRSRFALKNRWVDGTPENTGIAIGLSRMFPTARFIFLLRRPTPVIRSMLGFDSIGGHKYTFEEAASTWERFSHNGYEAYLALRPHRAIMTTYEDMVHNPADCVARWFAFLGEPQFSKAADTYGEFINSSRNTAVEFDADQQRTLASLEAIYDAMLTECPITEIPWRADFGVYADRENHIMQNMLQVLRG